MVAGINPIVTDPASQHDPEMYLLWQEFLGGSSGGGGGGGGGPDPEPPDEPAPTTEEATSGGPGEVVDGDELDNYLVGTTGDDTIRGYAGNDTLNGGNGNDRIDGGTGIDRIVFSGSSAVTVNLSLTTAQNTGRGYDTILNVENVSTGIGNDKITGSTASNSINAGDGNDTISGGSGNDSITGGLGNDLIDGGAGYDRVSFTGEIAVTVNLALTSGQNTGYGRDTILNVEHVKSGSGDDFLTGNSASNNLDAGEGNDILRGAAGNDTLNGDLGNDTLEGGSGNDRIVGGEGIDVAVFNGTAAVSVNLSLTGAQNTGYGSDSLLGVENVTSGSGNDRLVGNSDGNELTSGAGSDTLISGAGNDWLDAGSGNDSLNAGEGNDLIDGGEGRDTLDIITDADVTIDLSLEVVQSTGQGDDLILGIENVTSGGGNDRLEGTDYANTLRGGAGDDTLRGEGGDDWLYGELGRDWMHGGDGMDTFVFNTALGDGNTDRISDFNPFDDTIRLSRSVFSALSVGTLTSSAFAKNTTGYAGDSTDRIIYESDTGKLYYDPDGTGSAARIHFATVDIGLSLTYADFTIY